MAPSQTPRKGSNKMMHYGDATRNHSQETPSIRRLNGSSSFSTPSLMTPAHKKEAPLTAATVDMTPMTTTTEVEVLSTLSRSDNVPMAVPTPAYLRDETNGALRSTLFPEDSPSPPIHLQSPHQDPRARVHCSPPHELPDEDILMPRSPRPPIPAQVHLSHRPTTSMTSTTSLPEHYNSGMHMRTLSSGSSGHMHFSHRASSTSSLRNSARLDDSSSFSVNDKFGIQERRRSSSMSVHQQRPSRSSRKSMSRQKTTPDTSSSSETSPEPSPERSQEKKRRRALSPSQEAELNSRWFVAKVLKRCRRNRFSMVLISFSVVSLFITGLLSNAVTNGGPSDNGVRKPFRADLSLANSGVRGPGNLIGSRKSRTTDPQADRSKLMRDDSPPKRQSGATGHEMVKSKEQESTAGHDKDHDSDHGKKHESDHHHEAETHKHESTHVESHHKKDDSKHHHKRKHDKHGKKHSTHHGTKKHASTTIKHVLRLKVQQPAHRLKLKESRRFDAEDISLYKKPKTPRSTPSRTVMLHTSAVFTQGRKVRSISSPLAFDDPTQLYGVLDSEDERVSDFMELRDPYTQGECVPMQDWQTTFHPSCNGMHEVALEHMGQATENDFKLFGTKGFWRNAWKLSFQAEHEAVVLKTLKFMHNFEEAHFEHDRIDAVAMERLTSSPHVINVFGFCGHSVLTEYADGKRLGELADKSRRKPLARLKIARDIADGLADVHGIDGDGNATFVHLDVNPANVVSIGGRLKLNDFNIGIILKWNTTSNRQCGFPAQYPNPQWRSPEEARGEQNLTEKVDVFAMGHIFFRLICGHEPWNKLEPDGKPSKDEVSVKVQKGELPFIPKEILESDDEEIIAIRDVMLKCYAYDPEARPSSREVANLLGEALTELTSKSQRTETDDE